MTSREAIAQLNILSSYDTSEEKREAYKDCIYAILKDLEVLEIIKKNACNVLNTTITFKNTLPEKQYELLKEGLQDDK